MRLLDEARRILRQTRSRPHYVYMLQRLSIKASVRPDRATLERSGIQATDNPRDCGCGRLGLNESSLAKRTLRCVAGDQSLLLFFSAPRRES